MFKRSALLFAATTAAFASPALAGEIVYNVSDYAGGKHGLWTNTYDSKANRFYSIQNGSTFTFDTDTQTAVLLATAVNASGATANMDIQFSGFLDNLNGTGFQYKKEGGVAYDAANDTPDIDFFSAATGTITIDGTVFQLNSNPFAGSTLFQYGTGANAKVATEFGGSAWLNVQGQDRHWDINVGMAAVPEPGTWAMLIFGFLGIGGVMRSGRIRRTNVQYA